MDAETHLRINHAGSRILLAEDNAINREVIVALLSSVALAADTAKDGVEAVEKINENAYDLVLMDVQMPGMDGLEAKSEVRGMVEHTDLPILAMTANVFTEVSQACLDVGMNDCIGKPAEPANLFAAIDKWLPE